jgi:hypothetical protein
VKRKPSLTLPARKEKRSQEEMTMIAFGLALCVAHLYPVARPVGLAPDLAPPVRIRAGGKPVDVERDGHAAPFVGDFDGDGKPDLLVGQLDGGKLRVYRNTGTKTAPKFDTFEWFRASESLGTIPAG